eukprot:822788-Prymnesium_polylepis.1
MPHRQHPGFRRKLVGRNCRCSRRSRCGRGALDINLPRPLSLLVHQRGKVRWRSYEHTGLASFVRPVTVHAKRL